MYRFLKKQRLRKTEDFERFRSKSVSSFCDGRFVLKVLHNSVANDVNGNIIGDQEDGQKREMLPRIGIVTSKKVGNAVIRNCVRRKVREVFRLNPTVFKKNHDYLFIALKDIARCSFADISNALLMAVEKLSNKMNNNYGKNNL